MWCLPAGSCFEFSDKETGKKHVQYKAIEAGDVKVTIRGLPEGIPFKKPSYYGVGDLNKIIEVSAALEMSGKWWVMMTTGSF